MQITHVIRGDEWMSSTPKHVLLYEVFGWTPPIFMHMPLLLGLDGKKLSKRKNPTSIFYYRDCGYLPEAFVNFLTLMGYSMTGDREIYPLRDIIDEFDYRRIGVSGAVFDINKLNWLNQQYLIQNIPVDDLWNRLREWCFPEEKMHQIMPLVHTRIQTFGEFMDLCGFLFVGNLEYTPELFSVKGLSGEQAALLLQAIIWHMDETEDWGCSGIEAASRAIAQLFAVNHKKIVMPLLFASIMGKRFGPPLFNSVSILGKFLTRARLMAAINFLGGLSKRMGDELKKAWHAKNAAHLLAREG